MGHAAARALACSLLSEYQGVLRHHQYELSLAENVASKNNPISWPPASRGLSHANYLLKRSDLGHI